MANCPSHLVPARVVERVAVKVIEDVDGCLLSTYATGSHGYSMVGFYENGVQYNALCHRVSWSAAHGEIPQGLVVHHKCFTRRCVNVAHMELLSDAENMARQKGDDWPLGTCKHGHPREMSIVVAGRKRCHPCLLAKSRRDNAKRKEGRTQSSMQHAA